MENRTGKQDQQLEAAAKLLLALPGTPSKVRPPKPNRKNAYRRFRAERTKEGLRIREVKRGNNG